MKLTQFGCDIEGFLLFNFFFKVCIRGRTCLRKVHHVFLPVKSGLSEAASIKIAATEIAPSFISPSRMKPLLVLQSLGSKAVSVRMPNS